ncbi:MAG: GLUG motif-containing protein [Cellvibrio sp.]|uniref:GLUG motif-containing protein n=1 Tax=Cellvibrio sp. TaxID=1965322 RepID=UPI0031B34889
MESLINRVIKTFAIGLLISISLYSFAADGRLDYDLDNDGLIEINDWDDVIAINNNLDGKALYGSSLGCPVNGCRGFELTTDLDFDTNGDGKLDAQDTYWNSGLGWQSIGTPEQPFSAIFEGNKHLIRNLMINRWNNNNQAFFGALYGATIRNLGFSGELMSITGASVTGALAAVANDSKISGCSSVGNVSGRSYVGGLVGFMSGGIITASFTGGVVNGSKRYVGGVVGQTKPGTLEAIFSSAIVTGDSEIGGIIGYAIDSNLSASLSTAYLTGNTNVGELLGASYRTTTFTPNYWLAQTQSPPVIDQLGIGLTLTQLQCPITADNTSCVSGKILYQDWGGHRHWHFGSANQLPGLVINDVTNRDNDGDGTFNADDLWPNSFATSKDTDGDGAVDSFHPRCDSACQTATGLKLDHFPNNSAASIDQDADGKPDAWNSSCDATCQNSSGLVLDTQVDNADSDSNGLIDISTWAQFNAIRNNPMGTGRQMNARGTIDSSGCPIQLIDGVSEARCNGYELKTDLDFDTNADGKLDSKDIYWNSGAGWVPMFFSATFDGNGHVIRNLMIDRLYAGEDGYFQGLFSKLENATVRDLGLTGDLMDIKGLSIVGGLAGSATNTSITGCFSTGSITSLNGSTGGLVGSLYDSSITNSLALGKVQTERDWTPDDWPTKNTGGIAGYASASNINAVFSSSTVNGYSYVSGIIGGPENTTSTGAFAIGVVNKTAAPDAVKLPALKCATATDNCANGQPLYEGWDKLKDSEGNLYWDFGDALQLPGLVVNQVIYRIDDNNQLTTTPLNPSSSSSSSSGTHSSSSTESSSSISSSISSSSQSSSPVISQPGSSGTKKGGGSADFALLLMLSGLVAGCLRGRRETVH